jgi:hypothetical protein
MPSKKPYESDALESDSSGNRSENDEINKIEKLRLKATLREFNMSFSDDMTNGESTKRRPNDLVAKTTFF